ncbi:ABC transporter permease [Chitinispirillum alkaliphilum]|nr:ABC transporter permease [Chitinispirillum alkaliphilum]
MRQIKAITADLRFQYRHGFYFVYAFILVVYIVLLRNLPDYLVEPFAVLLILSDSAVLGFFFIGGILLLERGQGILDALFITPLRPREYLVSKVVSLTVLSLLVSLCILLGGAGFPYSIIPVIAGIGLTSSLFILFGCMLGLKATSVNSYFAIAMVVLFPMFLPLLGYFGIYDSLLWNFLPTHSCIVLTSAYFGHVPPVQMIQALFILILWNLIFSVKAQRYFSDYLQKRG